MNNSIENESSGSLTEPYISFLNSANPMPVKIGRDAHTPTNQAVVNLVPPCDTSLNAFPLQDMHRQEEEYRKSVTIIFWYQANILPVRLHHMIPNFPYFQLSKLTALVQELGLTSNTYLDTYNPDTSQWDQHSISAVRKVESQQRLLYRLRKSLLDGFKDEDCLGLPEELKMQRQINMSFRARSPSPLSAGGRANAHGCICKRALCDDPDVTNHVSHKVHIPNNYYLDHQPLIHRNNDCEGSLVNDTRTSAPSALSLNLPTIATSEAHPTSSQSLPTPPSSSSSDDFAFSNIAIYDNNSSSNASPRNISSSNLAIPISPYPPHPPLKRWPNDYTVAEISAGFSSMDALVTQSTNGSILTHRAAFERVFGSRYVKSTVCRHRGLWKKAQPNLKAQYEAMGHDERACWGEFVRAVEGRSSSLRVAGPNSTMNTPNINLISGQDVTLEDGDEGTVDKTMVTKTMVTKTLEGNQVEPTMQGIDAYSSPLTSLGNAARS